VRSNRTAVEDEYDRPTGLPAQIPARGWMDILLRVYQGFSEDRILANAAGMTYYALLGLFPGIAAVVSIYGIFADPSTIVSQVNAVAGFVPEAASTSFATNWPAFQTKAARRLELAF